MSSPHDCYCQLAVKLRTLWSSSVDEIKKKQENDQRAKTGVYNFHTIGNSVATTFQTNKLHNRNTQRNGTVINSLPDWRAPAQYII